MPQFCGAEGGRFDGADLAVLAVQPTLPAAVVTAVEGKGRVARQQHVQDDPQAPDVAPLVVPCNNKTRQIT